MKAYSEYMNRLLVSDTLHQRLVSCAADVRPVRRPITIRRYAAAFACLAVVLISVFTMPRLTQHNVAPTQDVAFSKYAFIFNKMNVQRVKEDHLSLDEARADTDFGAYLPVTLPNGFAFEDALRFINQEQDALFVSWTKGMGYINWRVSLLEDNDKTRITSVADKKNYDLSLYPIPRADSVPGDLREIVDNPIFLSEELTLEVVQTRAYEIADAGDEPGHRMRFSVLYGDILVEISAKGVSPDALVNILQQIKQ